MPEMLPLSPRQAQVLDLIVAGMTTREIAVQLSITFKTAEAHRQRIREKLDVHNTVDMIKAAHLRKAQQSDCVSVPRLIVDAAADSLESEAEVLKLSHRLPGEGWSDHNADDRRAHEIHDHLLGLAKALREALKGAAK